MANPTDPFREERQRDGVKLVRAEGQDVPLLLRLRDIKRTCKDTETFSNDNPLMIVLHSEASVRDVRQLPIESDPPSHAVRWTRYRPPVSIRSLLRERSATPLACGMTSIPGCD